MSQAFAPRFLRRLGGAAAVLVCLAFLAGCGSKVSKDNYDKVKVGMTQAEVEAILGAGQVANNGGGVGGLNISIKTETWTDGDKNISVMYGGDNKVQMTTQKGL